MTYLTAPPNVVPPIDKQSGTTGRVTKEDDSQINVANWICEVSDPESGVSVNVHAEPMELIVEDDEGKVLSRMQEGRTLFQSDFQQGLDTLNKFHMVYNGAANLPGKVNDSATGGDGEVSEADFSQGYLQTEINYNGAADNNQWVIQSQTPMKFKNSENGFAQFTGRFANAGAVGVQTLQLVSRVAGVDTPIEQGLWNIDTMVGGLGPSEIQIAMSQINSFIILIPLKDTGDVKVGFIVDNTIYYVHQFTKNNASNITLGLVNKPLRIEGTLVSTNQSKLRMGVFNDDTGYFFQVTVLGQVGPQWNQRFYSMACYASGANRDEFYRTFSKGNGVLPIGVTSRVPLVSLKPKQVFPPSAGTINNEVIVSLKEINIAGTSLDLNESFFVEIIFNQGPTLLTGAGFNITDANSSVDIDVEATAISAGGTQIYSTTVYANKGKEVFNMKEILSNFMNNYTCTTIEALGFLNPVTIDPTISIVATSVSGNSIAVSAEFVWGEKA